VTPERRPYDAPRKRLFDSVDSDRTVGEIEIDL
jgi:hypothetical protein